MTLRLPWFVALLACTSCVIGSDKYPRPRDLPQSWLVDRPRLLAVRADPAEASPGETVTFSALLPDPTSTIATVLWLACPFVEDAESDAPPQCEIDTDLDLETASIEELAAAGLIGVEPGFPPTYTVPEDVLEGVEDPAEGSYVTIQVTGLPELSLDDTAIDFNAVEAGYKRLVVSEATTPNHNPDLAYFTVEGQRVSPGSMVELDPHQTYEIGVVLADDAVEDYQYVNSDGISEDRTEEPYVTWYATSGTIVQLWSLHPHLHTDWVSGGFATTGSWYAVVRDRRGGMAWLEQQWIVGRGLVE